MTVSEIAEAHGVSRQTVHAYRSRGTFPKPVEGEGSTRPRFREDEVAAFFAANPKRPGRRTDRETATEGVPMDAQLVDTLETEQVLNNPNVLAAEQSLWDVAGLSGPNPEFLAAIRDYRRAVLLASALGDRRADG